MKKRLIALLVCIAMTLCMAPALAETADMPTITIWAGMSSNCPEETMHQGTIRDLLGINYTVEWTQGDFLTTLNMKINAGELADICVFWNDTVAANALINSGLVQSIIPILRRFPRRHWTTSAPTPRTVSCGTCPAITQ